MRGRWRDVRAGLIAVAIFLALVEGCPIPPPHETLPWQEGYVGVIRPVQRTIMKPFAWIPKRLRFTQRFALFQAAEPDRFRLEVIARVAGGGERVVFRAGDEGPYTDELVQRRVRGVCNPTYHTTSQWPLFVDWFARRVLAAQPDAEAVMFPVVRVHIEDGTPRDTDQTAFEALRGRP
jgi:hypothetical protein